MTTFQVGKEPRVPGDGGNYQDSIDSARRRREIALSLMKDSQADFNGPAGQMVSGHYVANSPMKYLSGILGSARGMRGDIARQIADAYGMASGKPGVPEQPGVPVSDEGPTPDAHLPTAAQPPVAPNLGGAIEKASTSPYPQVREIAKTLQTRQSDWFKQAAPVSDPNSVVQSQGLPGGLKPLQPNAPTVGTVEAGPNGEPGGRYIQTVDPRTQKTEIKFVPKEMRVTATRLRTRISRTPSTTPTSRRLKTSRWRRVPRNSFRRTLASCSSLPRVRSPVRATH
jgi:hypothetical protein